MTPRTLIIFEAGVNHNGDLALAKRLVDAAAEAGADVVKFQTFDPDAITTTTAPQAGYQQANTGVIESQHAMLRRLALPPAAFMGIRDHAVARGIEFLSTPFDLPSVAFLGQLGLRRWKIASGEITNLPLLRAIGAYGQVVLLSTGMADLDEVRAALDALMAAGTPRERVTVLQCHTEYPTEPRHVNLRAMVTMRDALGVRVGYSDHTLGIAVPIAAVALGATVIEKHCTLDRALPGPDHAASLEPTEFAAMVQAIRAVEQAFGDGVKRPSDIELPNRAVARKSIVASRSIRAGERITADAMTTKRPGMGVSPMMWDRVVGSIASHHLRMDDPIVLESDVTHHHLCPPHRSPSLP